MLVGLYRHNNRTFTSVYGNMKGFYEICLLDMKAMFGLKNKNYGWYARQEQFLEDFVYGIDSGLGVGLLIFSFIVGKK